MLEKEEITRYSRHLSLPGLGTKGQEKLKGARVLVIGAGGLGCPALQYLAAAGVGEIGILDFDKVELSNLQRQVLYTAEDVGMLKAMVAAEQLLRHNRLLTFIAINVRLSNRNALSILSEFDVVIDATDDFPTRYVINDACDILGMPFIYGSVDRFEGQVSVFNYENDKGQRGPSYRCLFPEPPSGMAAPTCAAAGVLGVLPGMIGAMQANEAIKIITGIGHVLSGKLLLVNALSMEFTTIDVNREDYEGERCAMSPEQFLKTDYETRYCS